MEVMVITNDGCMDLEAFTMMGLSSKRDNDDKIGMFGTGNKYAISVFLREGYDIEVSTPKWAGKFGVEKKAFRGQEYSQVILSLKSPEVTKHELGITTSMGLKWSTDNAMREFICNAKDEGGMQVKMFSSLDKARKYCSEVCRYSTAIMLTGKSGGRYFSGYMKKFDETYLFNREPLYESSSINLYEKLRKTDPLRVYRNGVLVLTKDIQSMYDYELNGVDITESRDASMWDAQYEFGRAVFTLPDLYFDAIMESVTDDHFEASGSSYEVNSLKKLPASLCDRVVMTRDLYEQNSEKFFSMNVGFVPENWYRFLRNEKRVRTAHSVIGESGFMPGKIVKFSELGDIEKMIVTRAVEFVQKAGYSITAEDIHYKEIEAFGMFSDGKIFLSPKYISRGVYETVNTIIHEIMHRESKSGDNTQGFQEFLVHEIVKQLMMRMQVAL